MYLWVLGAHSGLRWVVILAGVAAISRALLGRSNGRPWTRADDRLGLAFVASLDLQLLIGLVLLFFGPVTVMSVQEPQVLWQSGLLIFLTVAHPALMLCALILAHLGRARVRRSADPSARHGSSLWFFGASLLLILAAIPWPFFSHGRPLFDFLQ